MPNSLANYLSFSFPFWSFAWICRPSSQLRTFLVAILAITTCDVEFLFCATLFDCSVKLLSSPTGKKRIRRRLQGSVRIGTNPSSKLRKTAQVFFLKVLTLSTPAVQVQFFSPFLLSLGRIWAISCMDRLKEESPPGPLQHAMLHATNVG